MIITLFSQREGNLFTFSKGSDGKVIACKMVIKIKLEFNEKVIQSERSNFIA